MVEDLIPALHESILVCFNYQLYPVDIFATESIISLKFNWFKPEFCFERIPFDMYMWWLIAITSIKEKTIWSFSQDGGHESTKLRFCYNYITIQPKQTNTMHNTQLFESQNVYTFACKNLGWPLYRQH